MRNITGEDVVGDFFRSIKKMNDEKRKYADVLKGAYLLVVEKQGWIKILPSFLREKITGRSTLQKIISNTSWLFMDKIIRLAVNLFVGIWLARYLGPQEFGIFNYVIAFVFIISPLSTLGLNGIVIRNIVRKPIDKSKILGTAFALKLVGGTLTFLVSVGIITWLHPGDIFIRWLVGITALGTVFQAFDVIDYFKIMIDSDGEKRYTNLLPLVILDDAHTLHPSQFRHLKHWLAKRELRVSRWILTRLDILHPGEALVTISEAGSEKTDLPGVTKTRDLIEIPLQSGVSAHGGRSQKRKSFRKMAKDMANRYLHKMPLFSQRELHSLSDLLTDELTMIPPGKYEELKESVDSARKTLGLKDSRYNELLNE